MFYGVQAREMSEDRDKILAMDCRLELDRFLGVINSDHFDLHRLSTVQELAEIILRIIYLFWQTQPEELYRGKSSRALPSLVESLHFPTTEQNFVSDLTSLLLSEYNSLDDVADNPLFLEHSWSALAFLAITAEFVAGCVDDNDFGQALMFISFYFWDVDGKHLIEALRLLFVITDILRSI